MDIIYVERKEFFEVALAATLTDKTKGEKDMGDKGSKDKGKKEEQKKSEHTLKEKRKLKQDKKNKPCTIPA